MPPESDVPDHRSQRERMLAGDPYVGDDPELAALTRRAARLADDYHRTALGDDDAAARQVLVELVGTLGVDVVVRPPLFVDYGTGLHLGDRTFVNFGLVALDVAPITIGADCQIGPGVQLLTPTHPLDPAERRSKIESAEPITLGDNVWLGGGVVVCPGVTIGDDTVVGAGSVVTRDLPAGVVAAGNPARILRSLPGYG